MFGNFIAEAAQELCYCAVKCGPREIVKGKDKPRIISVNVDGDEYDVLFCADRDERIFRNDPEKCKITAKDIKALKSKRSK